LNDLLGWLRTLDSVTLHEYRKAMGSTDPKHTSPSNWGRFWGDSTDLLIAAGTKRLDDGTTALLLFVSNVVGSMEGGSAASRSGADSIAIYDESHEYLSGLYDTLRYHRELSSTELTSALFGANIFTESQESQESITSLLTVTDQVVSASLREFCRTPNQHDPYPPHAIYASISEYSLWLRNGELVKYILDHPKEADLIAGVIVERKTDNIDIIAGVLEHEVSAFSSGSL
jgi:hypothetical protein